MNRIRNCLKFSFSFFLALSSLFLASCKSSVDKVETCFTENGIQIDSFETTFPLKGELAIHGDSISGLYDFICTDKGGF